MMLPFHQEPANKRSKFGVFASATALCLVLILTPKPSSIINTTGRRGVADLDVGLDIGMGAVLGASLKLNLDSFIASFDTAQL